MKKSIQYCKCCSCGKEVVVRIPKYLVSQNPEIVKGITCNSCVSADSAARDGINESIFVESTSFIILLFTKFKRHFSKRKMAGVV